MSCYMVLHLYLAQAQKLKPEILDAGKCHKHAIGQREHLRQKERLLNSGKGHHHIPADVHNFLARSHSLRNFSVIAVCAEYPSFLE